MGLSVYSQYLLKKNYNVMPVFVFCYKQHSIIIGSSCLSNRSMFVQSRSFIYALSALSSLIKELPF